MLCTLKMIITIIIIIIIIELHQLEEFPGSKENKEKMWSRCKDKVKEDRRGNVK